MARELATVDAVTLGSAGGRCEGSNREREPADSFRKGRWDWR